MKNHIDFSGFNRFGSNLWRYKTWWNDKIDQWCMSRKLDKKWGTTSRWDAFEHFSVFWSSCFCWENRGQNPGGTLEYLLTRSVGFIFGAKWPSNPRSLKGQSDTFFMAAKMIKMCWSLRNSGILFKASPWLMMMMMVMMMMLMMMMMNPKYHDRMGRIWPMIIFPKSIKPQQFLPVQKTHEPSRVNWLLAGPSIRFEAWTFQNGPSLFGGIPSLKLTAKTLKMDGWKMIVFLLGFGLFSGCMVYVSFKKGNYHA